MWTNGGIQQFKKKLNRKFIRKMHKYILSINPLYYIVYRGTYKYYIINIEGRYAKFLCCIFRGGGL